MAFSNLEKAMATFIGLDILRPGTSRTAAKAALGTLIRAAQITAPYAGRAALTGVPALGTAAAAFPATTGAALGAGFLATPPGEAVLEMAAERGRSDRDRFDAALALATGPQVKAAAKRKVKSKYNQAVSAAMKAVKASNKGGKKGTISNPKRVFSTVSKAVSKVNKGLKPSVKGITGIAARAARKKLGKGNNSKATYTFRKN